MYVFFFCFNEVVWVIGMLWRVEMRVFFSILWNEMKFDKFFIPSGERKILYFFPINSTQHTFIEVEEEICSTFILWVC